MGVKAGGGSAAGGRVRAFRARGPSGRTGGTASGTRQGLRRPRLLIASVVLATPDWVRWALPGHHGAPGAALRTTLILAANFALTRLAPGLKARGVRLLQRYVINPPVRILVEAGVLPLGYALIETTGRVSGRARRTPVGNGLVGDTFWIVAEHGYGAGYVRNLLTHPRVRVKVRSGVLPVWHEGTAHVLEDDDPHARQRYLGRRHPLRALNAAVVRVMGSELLTVRIDLDPRPKLTGAVYPAPALCETA